MLAQRLRLQAPVFRQRFAARTLWGLPGAVCAPTRHPCPSDVPPRVRAAHISPPLCARTPARRWYTTPSPPPPDSPKHGLGKLKALVKEHGLWFLVYWTVVWIGTGVALWLVLELQVVPGGDAQGLIRMLHLDWIVDPETIPASGANAVVAVAVNEALEVVRFPLVLVSFKTVRQLLRRAPK